jgi:plasmid maintenance system antidote protein VapI
MQHLNPEIVLGDLLREFRLQARVDVRDLANQMRWPTAKLQRLEDGSGDVSFIEAAQLVRHFNLDIEEFACAYITNLDLSHADFNALEAELACARIESMDDEYFAHD